jgi:hypothetical protein
VGEAVEGWEKQGAARMLKSTEGVFSFSAKELGTLKWEPIRIELDDERPVYRSPYKHSPPAKKHIQEKCHELLTAGRIEEVKRGVGDKGYAAPTVAPAKKDISGQWTELRMCGDYRRVNGKTVKDMYRMPTPEEIFDSVGKARVFSNLDLRSGYHQLPLHEEDKAKTTFWGVDAQGREVRYQWKYLPFGLKNAPSEFQRVLDRVLEGLPFARAYIDDILVYSDSVEEHKAHLREVFQRLREAGLTLHPEKCAFFQVKVPYLGHMVVPGGVEVQEAKVEAISQVPAPKDVSALRAFLGLTNYYRRFVPNYSRIARPLTLLTRLDEPWRWEEEQREAFRLLKSYLADAPRLNRPDPEKPYTLHTDWSVHGLGAVLIQLDEEGQERVVAYASRSNNRAESNYSSYEGECLAVVWAVQHFRAYLWGNSCTVVTDHQPLLWLMSNDRLRGKLARWALILQEYDLKVRHRPGTTNQDADGLSRNPLPTQEDLTGVRHDEDTVRGPGIAACLAAACEPMCCALCASQQEERVMWWPMDEEEGPQALEGPEQVMEAVMAVAQELIASAVADEAGELPGGVVTQKGRMAADIWEDGGTLSVIAGEQPPAALEEKEKERMKRRASRYRWADQERGILERIWPGTGREAKVVPPPHRRVAIILALHQQLGHFGVRRTAALVRLSYWWAGLYQQVATVLRTCVECDRVRATFNAPQPLLHPLPIQGLGYRWSVDLAGPLHKTVRGNKYVMVCIEHFSKWAILVPIPDKTSEVTSQVFLERVLAVWGAPAVVLTDQGKEFQGAFDALCYQALIDHRTTSRDHPECDGLAERMVQTTKQALRKVGLAAGHNRDWDLQLPWLSIGYNFSRQQSLSKFSPYQLVYGREPVLAGALHPAEEARVLELVDQPEAWVASVSQRAELFRRTMPLAMENLAIAQQRDTQRYAKIRGGGYRPRVRRFLPGDYVYLQQTAPTTLDVTAGRVVLRVEEVGPSGVLTLIGRDGVEVKDYARNVTPCHLPHLEGAVDPTAAVIPAGLRCQECGDSRRPATMILCDVCSRGWHLSCLRPPLQQLPDGEWVCTRCSRGKGHA